MNETLFKKFAAPGDNFLYVYIVNLGQRFGFERFENGLLARLRNYCLLAVLNRYKPFLRQSFHVQGHESANEKESWPVITALVLSASKFREHVHNADVDGSDASCVANIYPNVALLGHRPSTSQ